MVNGCLKKQRLHYYSFTTAYRGTMARIFPPRRCLTSAWMKQPLKIAAKALPSLLTSKVQSTLSGGFETPSPIVKEILTSKFRYSL